jgi:predicted PurR-regulated permease PerM
MAVMPEKSFNVLNWIKNHLAISFAIIFLLGIVATIGVFFSFGRFGQLDSIATEGRATIAILTENNRALTDSNQRLGERLDSIQRGIAEAKAIAGRQYEQTGDIITELRRVIETLKAVKTKLASITDH